MGRDDQLFTKGNLRATLANETNKMADSAEKAAPDEVLRLGVEGLADKLAEQFTVQSLHINWEGVFATPPEETKVDVRFDQNRFIRDRDQPFYLPGTQVTFVVPFEGDPTLFQVSPSTWSSGGPPSGQVVGRELRLSFSHVHPTPDGHFFAQFESSKKAISQYAVWVDGEVGTFNKGLPATALAAAKKRHEKVSADQNLLTSLGVPIRRPDDAVPVFAAPVARRPRSPRHRPGLVRGQASRVLPAAGHLRGDLEEHPAHGDCDGAFAVCLLGMTT